MIGLRRALIALAVMTAALGLMVIAVVLPSDHARPRGLVIASALVIGWSYAGVGLVLWWKRPAHRAGILMCAVGVTLLIQFLAAASNGYLLFIGRAFEVLPYFFLSLMLISFPDGRFTCGWNGR